MLDSDGTRNPPAQRLAGPRSAYVHVPFCAHRCGYCDFTLVAGREDLIDDYLRALETELNSLGQPVTLDTLFVGGGTPTLLSAAQLDQLMRTLQRWFHLADGYEFSVEANPFGLDADKVGVLAMGRVNRVSLGVQSFEARTLALLERDHTQADVVRAVQWVREAIDNISFDLIFAVPGQTLLEWRNTLRQAIDLRPQHVSTYGLTFEKGTAFWSRRRKHLLEEAPDEQQREMYSVAMDQLTAAHFEQYEISNFSLPGRRCRHNEACWKGLPYYGFGPGAARYMDGRRETNHRSVTTWLKYVQSGRSPLGDAECLPDEERAREQLIIGLRLCDGVSKAEFRAQTGYSLEQLAGPTIQRHCRFGLLEETGSHLRLTREGRFLADSVFVDLV